jgi:pSer/pThr/pTyr-binding forkhead associated (FHA) protein
MPKLNVVQPGEEPEKMAIELSFSRVNFGRDDSNDIVLKSTNISSNHCYMERVEGGFQLIDLGSTNGICFNGRRFDVIHITSDIEFHIGDVWIQFTFSDEEYEILDSEESLKKYPVPKLFSRKFS